MSESIPNNFLGLGRSILPRLDCVLQCNSNCFIIKIIAKVFNMCQFCSASEVTSKVRPGLNHVKNHFKILIVLHSECLSVNLFSRVTFNVCEIVYQL